MATNSSGNGGRRMTAEKLEHIFLVLTAGMLVVFLGALFWASFGLGMHLPDRGGQIVPSQVRATPPFDNPGVHQVAEGEWEVVALGMAWAFQPREIRVPAGEKVTFIATATDVIHGFHVEGTKVNFMMIPGQIARVEAVFREPGEHLIICHEYCGAGHHLMYARLIVEEEGWRPEEAAPEAEETDEAEADESAPGEPAPDDPAPDEPAPDEPEADDPAPDADGSAAAATGTSPATDPSPTTTQEAGA
jgi:cytochrome c oxidase subunit 2